MKKRLVTILAISAVMCVALTGCDRIFFSFRNTTNDVLELVCNAFSFGFIKIEDIPFIFQYNKISQLIKICDFAVISFNVQAFSFTYPILDEIGIVYLVGGEFGIAFRPNIFHFCRCRKINFFHH